MPSVIEDLGELANPKKAKVLSGFFKTGKGQYGEGDIFLGISVPKIRKLVKKYKKLSLMEIEKLLMNLIHEHRLAALLILVEKYKYGTVIERKEIFDFYIKNLKKINNWDLVDSSAERIVGEYLYIYSNEKTLYNLARSDNLWERRIAIIATYAFIKKGKFNDTLAIAETLLSDKQDLIHKAVGWMLREMGKRGGMKELEGFLMKYHKTMPRTMLRYAIEKFSKEKREFYMRR